ncbi:MAG: diacylglycerol/lipid kinase family protein [Myxococcota bacterium]
MWVQPLRTAELRVVPPAKVETEPRVAVLLNANARRVNEKVVRALGHVVPQEDLFLSRTELDARRIAQTVVDRRYPTVFCGGGDGTFTRFVNEILKQVELKSARSVRRAPRFGVLRLGTGNSLASMLNASPLRGEGILDDVLRARAGEVPGYRRVDLLEVEGQRAPFAGLGLDGKVLNDYIWVKENLGRGPLRHLLTGGRGYFTSVALRTVPHYLLHSTWVECEVVNGKGRVAYRLGPDGLPVGEPIEPGGTLFRGRLMMAAAGTIPFYGFEFKMFPFAARRRGMMHLRLGAISTPVILAHLPKLWTGKWYPKGLYDFHAQEVHIRFGRPMPFQVAGDAEGYRDEVTLGVASEQVELVDFTGVVN